jgi:3-oxosteroid 1-dehydrogenase
MASWDETCDFVIIGSGAASVLASLLVKDAGKTPVILEKTDLWGGSTAMSGGVLWVPNNAFELRAGVPDTPEKARVYLDACVGDVGPASSPERRKALLETGPGMIDYLVARGMKFVHAEGYSDYHENEKPGGMARGRALVAALYDTRRLGVWRSKLRLGMPIPILVHEAAALGLEGKTLSSAAAFARLVTRMLRNKSGSELVGLGAAVQGRLLEIALRSQIDMRVQTPVTRLIEEGGRVAGVEIESAGTRRTIRAKSGVLINAGGFSHNAEMRNKYGPQMASVDWTLANPGDTGEILQKAMNLGADTALMEQSVWVPTSLPPSGARPAHAFDISKPFSILVDESGRRFINESTSYVALGNTMYERNKTVKAVPSWFITDRRYRDRYRWGGVATGDPPKDWLDSGYMICAQTVDELARKCGIDGIQLAATVQRFNEFARTGVDKDFHRGESAYNRFPGDVRVKPNPNLGSISVAPFYAVRIYPGDVGTCGGLMTDERGRVMRADGSRIGNLYATGNSTASVLGHSYPGPGASISSSMVFGYLAARHAMQINELGAS